MSTQSEIVWGAANIAPHLGRSVKGAFGALESGRVPGAKKVAGRWALNLRVYHASFGEMPAPAARPVTKVKTRRGEVPVTELTIAELTAFNEVHTDHPAIAEIRAELTRREAESRS